MCCFHFFYLVIMLSLTIASDYRQWDSNYGSAWTSVADLCKSTQIREILDSGSVDGLVPIECEVRCVTKLENCNETWVAQLCDPGSSAEAPALDWLLHHKYHVLMANSTETLKRSSSRGFFHTLAHARSMRSYTGRPLLQASRQLRICSAQLHHRWNRTPPSLSLLPAEDCVILLQNVQESDCWIDYNVSLLAKPHPTDATFSFKAVALSVPPNFAVLASSTDYIQPTTTGLEALSNVDIILGDSSNKPIAVLRLASTHRLLSLCFKEGDLLCLLHGHLLAESHQFTSSGSVFPLNTEDPAEVVRMRYNLPLFSYESDTLLMALPKDVLEGAHMMDVTREQGVNSANNDEDDELRQAKNFRFHGPKVSPLLLQPHWSNVTMVGYVTQVEPRDKPTHGFRRYGFRLKDTNTSHICDVTTWESLESPSSMVSLIHPGDLVLVKGVWTVLRKRDHRLLANVTQEIGDIVNISKIEGFLASHPDIGPSADITQLQKPLLSTPESRGRTFTAHGPFPILCCSVSPSTMTLPISLYHLICRRSLFIQPQTRPGEAVPAVGSNVPIFCKFCSASIADWKLECIWQFEVEWHLQSANTAVTVLATPDVSEKLLSITASDFLQLSGPEKDMIVLNRVTDPIQGRAFVSRSPNSRLQLVLFTMSN